MQRDWYKTAVFYQIWVRSFADGNGDGIGDLYGVYKKLPYIKSLGVNAIWFSPLYPSPNADFGYDISDYCDIHPDYGTLDQFKKVLDRAHEMGIRVVMDLVINHTSDEHKWFKESCKGKDNEYSDYYIWRDKPNNWNSIFEGKAWEYNEERGQYYLHIFAKKQPDLNMDNPKVREEVKKIMRFWLDMGVDGFREDVITFISKKEGLPDGLPFLPIVNGMPYYKDGPHIIEYLKEFREVSDEYGAVQIGEGPMTTVRSALKYLTGPEKTLDLMFSFDHMLADCFYTEYLHRKFDLVKLKRAFSKWQRALNNDGWNTLYLENHDHPRIISRYGSERHWKASGKMLAACYMFQKGTPFIYQGQEIGMTNIRLRDIAHYVDVSSIMNFNLFNTDDPINKRMARIHISSRDSSRTPMQWNGTKYAGFSRVKPWFYVNRNYKTVNVKAEEEDHGSILNFYRKCTELKSSSKTLIYGSYREFFPKNRHIYTYERKWDNISYLVICSFSSHGRHWNIPDEYVGRIGKLALCNYPMPVSTAISQKPRDLLRPYEVRVYRYKLK